MKKYKKYVVGLLLTVISIFLVPTVTNAAEKIECTKDYISKNYGVVMDDSKVNDDGTVTFTSKKEVKFNVIVSTPEYEQISKNEYTVDNNKPLTVKIPKISRLDAWVTIPNDPKCGAKDVVYTFETEYVDDDTSVPNINYDGICATYRTNAGTPGTEKYNYYYKFLSYCFEQKVAFNYGNSNLTTMVKGVNTSWDNYKKLNTTGVLSQPTGTTVVTNTNLKNTTLSCDTFSDQVNVKKYYYRKDNIVNNGVCKVSCDETFTVTYDPPVSAKGGVCFTYSVKVESKVTCATQILKAEPQMPPICSVYGYCNAASSQGSGYSTSDGGGDHVFAGPSQAFDSCVLSCDGGKYSKKCINKCYNDIYKSGNLTKTANDFSLLPTKTADSCPNIWNMNSSDIVNQKASNPLGRYEYRGGSIIWVPTYPNCQFSAISPAYLNTVGHVNAVKTALSGGYRDGYGCTKSYWVDNGNLRSSGCYGTCAQSCGYRVRPGSPANCALNEKEAIAEYNRAKAEYDKKIAECSNVAICRNNTATYNMEVDVSIDGKKQTIKFGEAQNHTTGNGNGAGTTKDEDGMIVDWGGQCYGKQNPQYDYMTKINFPGSWIKKKGDQVVYKKPDDEDAYLKKEENKFCLPESIDNVNSKWWVWDQIGLNGTKRPNLTESAKKDIQNDIEYNIRANVGNFGLFGWDVKVQCFYSTYNQPNDDTPGCLGDASGIATSCNTCTTGGKCGDTCLGGECNNTTNPTNLNTRTVDLSDLFPGNEETSKTLSNTSSNLTATKLSYINKDEVAVKAANGRVIGWNWSCSATNVNNSEYKIIPTTLISHIQNSGDNIFNDNNELDYDIYLDKNTINYLKNTVKNSKDYTKYCLENEGKLNNCYKMKNNINSYTSDIINKLAKMSVGNHAAASRNTKVGCNNTYNGKCTNFSDVSGDSCVQIAEQVAATNGGK